MGENLEILRNELEKANDIVSNINRKLMTEFVQYLIAKSFYINPDRSQYSSYPYHPDELVESHVQNSVAINVPQRSKKWVALEDMTLLTNWSNFLADQPPQFKRLSTILLKKPSNFNILTDTLNFNNDTGKGNKSSLCGTIKIKQLIIDYNRMTKLYARLGKGICRCLNSCYYRAKLLLVGSGNPQVTGPFSEPEAHLCYNLYKSLQQNPNHTLDYVCEQVGKSLNRPPQLIVLFLETLEQIKGNSIPKITGSPPKNTTNTLNSVSLTIPSVLFASQSFHNELTGPIPTPPQQPIPIPTLASDNQIKDLRPLVATCPNLVALESVASGNPYESVKCRRGLTQGIKAYTWPSKVNDVLIEIIKWHYNYKLDFDFEALVREVAPQVLRSTISCLQIDWTTLLRTLIKSCTTLPPCYLDPCIEIFDYYWKHKLRQLLYLNLTDDKTVNNAKLGPVYYERAYLDSFFTRLRVFVAFNKPEKAKHTLLISVISRSCPTLGARFEWDKVTQLYNAESNDATSMTEEQLKIMFDDMKQTYVRNHTFLPARNIIRDLSAILIGGKNQGGKNKDKFQCFDNTNSLDFNHHTFKDREEPNVPKIVEDECEIVEQQAAVYNAHEFKHLLKDSPNSTAITNKKHSKVEDKVRLKEGGSHSSDNLRHEVIGSEAMPLQPEIPSKMKEEVDKSDGVKFFKIAEFRSETELMGKDKTSLEAKNLSNKSKSESSENNSQLSESMAKQELSEIRRSLFKNYRKFEIFIKKNRMNLTPERLRLYKSTLVSLCDESFLGRVKTDPALEICKQEQNINIHSEAKEQLDVDEDIPVKLKKIKKLKEIKEENVELDDKILELPDSMPVKKKHKNITDSAVKSQIVENKVEVCDRKSLKQKSSKSKTPEIIEYADIKSDFVKERCKEEEIINELSETPSKKLVKSKKRDTKEFSTEKKKSRKKEKIEAQELNMGENRKEVKSGKEITICKKLDFESTGSTHEEMTKDATKKLKKSKKGSISEIDNQETSLNPEPSSHKKKHKVKVAHHDEDKDVLIKVKKSKVKKAEGLDNVDAPMCNLDADQNESNVSIGGKLKKKKRALIDNNPNHESVVELPRKKKSKKIVELNDDCQESTPKIKKRDKKVKASSEATEQISPGSKDLQPFQEVLKTSSSKSRKSKFESDSREKGEPSAFAKTENTNVSDDEPVQILSPQKINVTRNNAKKHLVITIEDSDDICEMEDDRLQTLGSDKAKSLETIKLQKLIEALGNNPNNQYRIINEIRKTVKLRST